MEAGGEEQDQARRLAEELSAVAFLLYEVWQATTEEERIRLARRVEDALVKYARDPGKILRDLGPP